MKNMSLVDYFHHFYCSRYKGQELALKMTQYPKKVTEPNFSIPFQTAQDRVKLYGDQPLEKLEAEVNAYQSEKFVQLVKRDTRTLEMTRKRVPKRVEGANTGFVHYSIHHTCAFGGKLQK